MDTRKKPRRKGGRKLQKINNTQSDEEVTPNLLFDIIEDILSRLPVKSLLRFKSVSKSWYSLISSSNFAKLHHLRQCIISDHKTMLIHPSVESQNFKFLKFTCRNDLPAESLEFPLKKYRKARALCSCNGLILLKNPHQQVNMFVLWNPATRTYTTFTCPNKILIYYSSFGLCYDASNDDYKVVYVDQYPPKYHIFSYKTNSWIINKDFGGGLIHTGPGLYVSGALHWLKSNIINGSESDESDDSDDSSTDEDEDNNALNDLVYKSRDNRNFDICCFYPIDGEFKELSKPSCFEIGTVFQLSDLKGKLCVSRYTNKLRMVEIWMMKKYGDCNSWSKLITIDNLHVNMSVTADYYYYVKPLCLTSEGSYVVEIFQYGIVMYHPKKNKFDEVLVEHEKKKRMSMARVLCWNESLLLPSRIDEMKKKQNRK